MFGAGETGSAGSVPGEVEVQPGARVCGLMPLQKGLCGLWGVVTDLHGNEGGMGKMPGAGWAHRVPSASSSLAATPQVRTLWSPFSPSEENERICLKGLGKLAKLHDATSTSGGRLPCSSRHADSVTPRLLLLPK